MACISSIVYEDTEVWFMDSVSSRHMTGMRSFGKCLTDIICLSLMASTTVKMA
jgi:hypothetical protein